MREGVYDLAPRLPVALTTQWGQWVTRSRVEVIGDTSDTRRVILLAPLVWRDPDGIELEVPAAYMSDGATIPRFAWWLMGGRLSLDFLRSAFVHDFACNTKHQTSADATVRFYRGLRTDNMPFWKADLARRAVASRWGPKW